MVFGDDPIGSLDPVGSFYTVLTTEAGDEESSALLDSIGVIGVTAGTTDPEAGGPRSGAIVARIGDQEGGASVALDPSLAPREPHLPGDVDDDGDADLGDLRLAFAAVGTSDGEPGFDARTDFDGNGFVSGEDLRIVFDHLPALVF